VGQAEALRELTLPTGCIVERPLDRLHAFCLNEYAFYDAIDDPDPGDITPIDVAITIAVNSFVNTASRLRLVQTGLAQACNKLLVQVPVDARLQDPTGVSAATDLLRAAVTVPWVLLPVATKVLHRKRRGLVPMLDQVVLDYYLEATENTGLRSSTQDKKRAAGTATLVLQHLRDDLVATEAELTMLCDATTAAGFALGPLRALDILLWTEVEPQGYDRT
jgi:hypothetical protein